MDLFPPEDGLLPEDLTSQTSGILHCGSPHMRTFATVH